MSNVAGSKWIRPEKRAAIYHRDGMCCVYCGADDNLSLDHLLPREEGGTHDATNLVTACVSDNSARGKLSMRKWLKVLRKRGIDTTDMADRIRALAAKPLDMAMGRRMLANRKAVA